MDEHLLRLSWALPLVLLLGFGGLWALKRLGVGGVTSTAVPQPTLVSTQALSEHTRLMVVRHQGRELLIVESTASIQLHALPPSTPPFHSAWTGAFTSTTRRG